MLLNFWCSVKGGRVRNLGRRRGEEAEEEAGDWVWLCGRSLLVLNVDMVLVVAGARSRPRGLIFKCV